MARILVVDDDVAVQGTIRLLLERAGHSVVTAGDGRKGLALCETGGFDLLFVDIFMPGMDGFETMRFVRQRHSLIPIIVISGRPISPEADSSPDFLTMATKLGAVSSLQKPFRPADPKEEIASKEKLERESNMALEGLDNSEHALFSNFFNEPLTLAVGFWN